MIKKTILIFVISAISFITEAQVIKVKDKNNKPIENVFIFSKNKSALTDKTGNADITEFEQNDSITFQHPSYQNIYISKQTIKRNSFEVKLKDGIYDLSDIVVSANKWEEKAEEVPCKITKLTKKEIELINPQTTADMISATNEVFVQKSQLGGGSPMIRGFSANRVLIVVDGIRMNNAIYRSGNLQNVISIDPNTIENSEIIFGPGSVIYGSDAIGGVMDFHTITPELSASKTQVKANALARYSSANNEKTGNLNFNIGGKKLASFTSFTYSDFDDLRMGNVGNDEYIVYNYVDRINGIDSIRQKSDKNIQENSGYSQFNILQKFLYKPNSKIDITYNFQYSELSIVPRYDRLIEYSDDKLKYAEWYYGPQKWMMNSLNLFYRDSTRIFDKLKFIVGNQNYEENRSDRKLNSDLLRSRTENLDIYTLNLDFEKDLTSSSFLFYGAEGLTNIIHSKGIEKNIINEEINEYPSRYPDDSKYSSFASYISYKNNLSEKSTVITGLRYSRVILAGTLDTTFYDFPFSDININTGSLNGSLGYVYRPNKRTQINTNISTGFRAPNLDDAGKIFDSEPGIVVVPNINLKPEYAYNLDLGIIKSFNNKVDLEATIFYTHLANVMVRGDFTFNGNDSIFYDGTLSKVEAVVNNDFASIYGFNISIKAEVHKNIRVKTFVTYTKGQDNLGDALRHVPPTFGSTHFVYKNKKMGLNLYFNYNSEISFANLSLTERDKPHIYASNSDGNPYSPAWYTANIKFNYKINDVISVSAAIENILNHRYRPYSSGIVAPGRNFIISLRGSF